MNSHAPQSKWMLFGTLMKKADLQLAIRVAGGSIAFCGLLLAIS